MGEMEGRNCETAIQDNQHFYVPARVSVTLCVRVCVCVWCVCVFACVCVCVVCMCDAGYVYVCVCVRMRVCGGTLLFTANVRARWLLEPIVPFQE
jgi:hypothetical protein